MKPKKLTGTQRKRAINYYLVMLLLYILFILIYIAIYRPYFVEKSYENDHFYFGHQSLGASVSVQIEQDENNLFLLLILSVNSSPEVITSTGKLGSPTIFSFLYDKECVKSVTIGHPFWLNEKRILIDSPFYSPNNDRTVELKCDTENPSFQYANTQQLPVTLHQGPDFVTDIKPSYFYPFDRYVLDMYISIDTVDLESLEEETSEVAPNIHIYIEPGPAQWQTNYLFCAVGSGSGTPCEGLFHNMLDNIQDLNKQQEYWYGNDAKTYTTTLRKFTIFTIDFQRPFTQRFLTIVVLISILAFIILLIFLDDISSFAEVSVGILLGLWGIQDILIPSYINERTIIHDIMFILYVLLACAAFARLILKPLMSRSEIEVLSQEASEFSKSIPAPFEQNVKSSPGLKDDHNQKHWLLTLLFPIGFLYLLIARQLRKKASS